MAGGGAARQPDSNHAGSSTDGECPREEEPPTSTDIQRRWLAALVEGTTKAYDEGRDGRGGGDGNGADEGIESLEVSVYEMQLTKSGMGLLRGVSAWSIQSVVSGLATWPPERHASTRAVQVMLTNALALG